MSNIERGRLAALEDRVRVLEDHIDLYRLVCRWGAAADIGSGATAGALFTDDGVLEFEQTRVEGAAAVAEMIDSEGQKALVNQGCAHVQGLPMVHVDGDRASATNYSHVYLHTDDGYEVWRVTANTWEFRRTEDGWRATRRTAHTIDGRPEARALLARAFDGGV